MGAVGGTIRALSGTPQVSTTSSVKNQALAGNINSLISGYQGVANAGDTALNSYISQYMGGQGAATKRTGQEIGAMDQFYNGSMSSQLAQLRAGRSKAMTDAANVASNQALAAQNRSRVGGSGGTGSYDSRLSMANLTPIRTQAALDNSNQERADLGYVTQNQIGLAGQRTNLATQNAQYGLAPSQMQMSMLQGRAGYLQSLGNLDQQNTFYGLKQAPNVMADIADSSDAGILNAAAAYSSVAGAGGGMARGGLIRGPGTETSDSIPARLSSGEFVVPAEAVDMPGVLPMLEGLRRAGLARRAHHFARGGMVTALPMEPVVHPYGYNYETRGEPGLAHRRWRYAAGGMVHDATVDPWDQRPVYRRGGLVRLGYADGGLTGSAQQLNARAMQDLTINWQDPTIVGNNGAGTFGGGGGGGGGMRRPETSQMPVMPPNADTRPNQYFTPSNYGSLTPQWQQWGNATSNYYNNPSSPGYVAPGTYE